ncbi:hypothetical protein [Oscillatoria sp. FACHB-1406]|uniref:hypothetical protein n=1 Tax=Oscillatoria sp. FACHB-1406 TaxID=2692846 RepID=UPI0018EFB91C|nr:hypothetical protein [Oscillatoria sp. FACHB-1406]
MMTTNILEMAAQVLASRSISRSQQSFMSAKLGSGELNEQEQILVRRVFYGVRHGLLKTVE